ncbi:MAG: peptide-methionine (S)-S-oxide reductase MsrA [Bacteroidales bacterium]|nr:peptide-methionine (S)-S-oxide reductase MsrA [Bacteroidales bacterium]
MILRNFKILFLTVLILPVHFSMLEAGEKKNQINTMEDKDIKVETRSGGREVATLGAGCFWCVEAIYEDLKGVESVVSGYSGGEQKNPTYQQVCSGFTGHAEVCQISFDPQIISFEEILEVFWEVHDPTTLNRQGADIGSQYRSVIFYHSEEQKKLAEESKSKADASGGFKDPVVTEISEFNGFYTAEKYHQDYFLNNPNQPYCSVIISPKVKKFRKQFKDQLK